MFNILPQEEKKKILKEYRLRLAVVSVFAVAALVLASLALLVPSYLLAVSKHSLASESIAVLEKEQSSVGQEKEVDTQIKEVNKRISLFSEEKEGSSRTPSEVILKVITERGSLVKIQSILYDISPVREHVVISGKAESRESLAEFVEVLKKDPSWSRVDLPIGSYVKSVDIDFTLVLERELKTPPKK